jgi:hypothetical protein
VKRQNREQRAEDRASGGKAPKASRAVARGKRSKPRSDRRSRQGAIEIELPSSLIVYEDSKLFRQTCLLQNGIGCVARSNPVVYNKPNVGYGAKPNFMVALSLALKTASFFSQILLELLGKIRH